MKKVVLLLSVAFLGFSCSSDDDGGSSVSNSDLEGFWNLTSRTSEIEELEPLNDCEKTSFYEFDEFNGESVFEFEYFESSFSDDECLRGETGFEIAYEIVDGKIIADEEEELDEIAVSVSGDTLTLTFTRFDTFFNVDTGENEEDSYEEVEVYTRANDEGGSSVSNSDDDDAGSSSDLIGTWVLFSETADGDPIELDDCELTDTLVFTSNTFTETTSIETSEGECDADPVGEFTYTADGSTIIGIDEGGDAFSLDYSVDDSVLALTVEIDDSEDDNGELTTFVFSYEKQ